MKLTTNRLFFLLLAGLLFLNLLQSNFTELLFDEAYYWYYARHLDWGYFDHPPMVALMIKISGWIFNGELGVRFLSCLMSVGLVIILWRMVTGSEKNKYLPQFFLLLFSMTLLNAYGFFTLPDTPLIFFTALFLWIYQRFLQKETIPLAIGLGLAMAALMYSKYHAILVILCVLFSNIRLVLSPYAWLAVLVALLSYIPHFVWLFENDFVSIRYHLFERPNRAYDFNDFTLGYLLNLIALFGLAFPWVYLALFRTRAVDKFTKALLYLVYGVLLFFFISSFQRRVQTQWLIVICVPMVVIVFRYMLNHPVHRKWIVRMAVVNVIILLFLRIGLVYKPFFPIVFETHGNKEWVQAIEDQVGDMPVVFENSYREAPMYAFYSGNISYSLNNLWYRENQYDIDGSEALIQGKKVLYIAKRFKDGDVDYRIANGDTLHGRFIDDFESFRQLECTVLDSEVPIGESQLHISVYNPYEEDIPLIKIRFGVAYLNSYKQFKAVKQVQATPVNEGQKVLAARDSTFFELNLPEPQIEDPGYIRIVISENGLLWGLNSANIKLGSWNR